MKESSETSNYTIQTKRNNNLRLLDHAYKIYLNRVKTSTANSKIHENMKKEVCEELRKHGKHFVTEARFIGGGIGDIFVLDDSRVIEILHTETNERFKKKLNYYPKSLSIEVVRCN